VQTREQMPEGLSTPTPTALVTTGAACVAWMPHTPFRGAQTPDQTLSVQSKMHTPCRPRLLAVSCKRVSMPSRRGARVAELQHPLMPLVLLEGDFAKAFVGRILSSLPLDERLRAREVSRGWRFFLEDASFWARVDLSARCGVNPRRLSSTHRTLALLRAACVRAQGNLLAVDLSGVSLREEEEQEAAAREWEMEREIERSWRARDERRSERSSQRYKTKVTLEEEEEEEEEDMEEEEEEEDEVAVVPSFVLKWAQALSVADKASLRDLVAPTSRFHDAEEIRALCRTLPLCRVSCCVDCSEAPEEALPLLRREPPFALLTIGELSVHSVEGEEQAPPQSVLDLASALTGHKGMERLRGWKGSPYPICGWHHALKWMLWWTLQSLPVSITRTSVGLASLRTRCLRLGGYSSRLDLNV